MKKRIKITITGAGGNIGYALLFRIASGQMFGNDTSLDLTLLETSKSLDSLAGVAMELDDCGFPLLHSVNCTDDANTGMLDANWVILIGAVPRTAGMERQDLLAVNGEIFVRQGQAINHAAADVKVLVVGNPCNTNAYIAMHNATDIPNNRFFAMTMLDELRARAMLANRAKVPINQVTNLCIWGNHSATQFPDFYQAKIAKQTLTEVIVDHAWLDSSFIKLVQQRGSEVIKARGASSAASAANAILVTVNRLINTAGEPFSIASCSDGSYGIDAGLLCSFPSTATPTGVAIVQHVQHNDVAKARINTTLEELRQEQSMVHKLGFIPK